MNADAVLKSWVVPKLSERILELGAVDLDDPKEIVGFISKYSTAITISDDIGHVLAWTWGAAARPTELVALSMVLTTTGVAGRLDLFDGPLLLGWEDGLKGLQLSEDLAAEIEAAEFEEVDGTDVLSSASAEIARNGLNRLRFPGCYADIKSKCLPRKRPS